MATNKDPKIHSGQVIPAKKGSVTESPKRQNFLESLFDSRRWLWTTRLWTKQTAALTGLVEAENKLADAYKERGRKIDELMDMPTILNADREGRKAVEFEAMMRREAAERAYRERFKDRTISVKQKDHEIRRLDTEEEIAKQEAEIRRLEHEKRLQALKADLDPKAGAQPKKTRGPSTTALFREKGKVDKEYAKRKAAIDASNDSAEKKKSDQDLLDRWREEQYERLEKQYGGVVD